MTEISPKLYATDNLGSLSLFYVEHTSEIELHGSSSKTVFIGNRYCDSDWYDINLLRYIKQGRSATTRKQIFQVEIL